MSSIVSRRWPVFGSVSASKERRWISIRYGTSSGFSRREKLLRVTGAASTRANSATPQLVGCERDLREDSGRGHNGGATLKSNTPPSATSGSWDLPRRRTRGIKPHEYSQTSDASRG